MGWTSGSSLFSEIAETIERYVSDSQVKYNLYYELIESFLEADCDTLNECVGISKELDKALVDFEIVFETEDDEEWPDGGVEDFR